MEARVDKPIKVFSQSQALGPGMNRNANTTSMILTRPRRTVPGEANETTRTNEATINARSNSEIRRVSVT